MTVDREQVQFKAAWKVADEAIAYDVVDFWSEQNLLPQGTDPAERVKQLIATAYSGERVLAVATGEIGKLPSLRREFVFIRVSVHPDARRTRIAYEMSEFAVRVLERWARRDPGNEIAGGALVIESTALEGASAFPEWPASFQGPADFPGGWHLVGYNKADQQVRVAWFNHTRVE